MPIRSLNSSVLRWPDLASVDRAVRGWARHEAQKRPELLKVGYFGSYARGDWGVGSDVDLVAIVQHSDLPFEQRSLSWDTSKLPVATELIIYTLSEWRTKAQSEDRFARVLRKDTVWVLER